MGWVCPRGGSNGTQSATVLCSSTVVAQAGTEGMPFLHTSLQHLREAELMMGSQIALRKIIVFHEY